MNQLLFTVLLLLQGIPVQQTGTITGVLRSADGKPAAGVRVAAVPQTDSLEVSAAGPTLSSIAETDANGNYKLDNVPPGRYYIAAGRLDLPTYYPGSQSMAVGRSVLVTAGLTVPAIDFVLNAGSVGRAEPTSSLTGIVLLTLPLDVRVEGRGKLPLLNAGKPTTIQLTPVTGSVPPISVAINASFVSVPPPVVDYRVTVENLPEGYTVKSIKADSRELADRIVKITSFSNPAAGNPQLLNAAAFAANMARLNANLPPLQSLSIVLDSTGASSARGAGVRVSGKLPPNTIRPLYLGGAGGTVFSDGSFEFRNVLPGRYPIVTLWNAPSDRALAASVVVGSNDVTNVEVVSTPVLPSAVSTHSTPASAGSRNPGSVSLVSLKGRVLDAETGSPLTAGTVFIVGDTWTRFDFGAEGKFEFQNLLPGNYEIEVQGIGYPTFRRQLVIEEKDVDLDLKAG